MGYKLNTNNGCGVSRRQSNLVDGESEIRVLWVTAEFKSLSGNHLT